MATTNAAVVQHRPSSSTLGAESAVNAAHDLSTVTAKQALTDSPWQRRWQTARDYMLVAAGYLARFALTYAYLISLLVLYFCGIQAVNIINAIFIGFFVSFLLFPRWARVAWIGLVAYTELIICVQFVWQFSFVNGGSGEAAERLWGLRVSGNLWYMLRYHLVILLFSVLQLHTFALLKRKELLQQQAMQQQSTVEPVTEATPNTSTDDGATLLVPTPQSAKERFESMTWVRYLKTMYQFSIALLYRYNFLLCYLTFSLITFVGEVTLFDLGYIVIFFVYLVLYQTRQYHLVRRSWLVACIYPAFVATSCYLYQFADLQQVIDDAAGIPLVRAIGLVPLAGVQLSEYLLQHVVALFLCVFQYRIFNEFPAESIKRGLILQLFPFWLLEIVEFVRRLCVVHLSKLIVVLLFVSAVYSVNILNGISLCYLMFVVPFNKTQSSTRLLLLVWLSTLIVLRMIYQLPIVHPVTSGNSALLSYIGFDVFNASVHSVSYYLRFEILVVYTIALRIVARHWKAETKEENPEFPVMTSEWPLLDFFTRNRDCAPPKTDTPQNRREWHQRISAHWIYEFGLGINFWMSNFYNRFGWEICQFVHLAVAVARMDVIGMVYLLFLAVWLLCPVKQAARVWGFYLVFIGCLMLFQYISALGYPPGFTNDFPWYYWPASVHDLVGFPTSPQQLYIVPDFFLFFFCALQWLVFTRTRANLPVFVGWSGYASMLDVDFTAKPRSHPNQLRFVIIRYFVWSPIILAFAQGTASVNILCFVFLCFSLYYISTGEAILLDRQRRRQLWRVMAGYTFIWFALQMVYQIPAYLIPISNSATSTYWSSTTRILLGLSKMSRNPVPGESDPIASRSIVIGLLLFLAILFQKRVNKSRSLSYMARFIKRDTQKAIGRARDFRNRRRQKLIIQSLEYERDVGALRKDVLQMRNRQSDVSDWIRHFKRREDEDGYVIVSQTADEHGRKQINTEVDLDDGFRRNTINRRLRMSRSLTNLLESEVQKTSDETERQLVEVRKPRSRAASTSRSRSKSRHLEEIVIDMEHDRISDYNQIDGSGDVDRPELVGVGFWDRCANTAIKFVYKLAVNYTDLYATESQTDLIRQRVDSKLWSFLRGCFYAICAHTALIAYLAVYINQIYHANILSTVPTLAVLLIGMLQRPHPNKRFWEFLIIFVELTVLLKYLFQLNVWQFNVIRCPFPASGNAWVYYIGIQHSCTTFFVDVLPEFTILLCCIAHRGLMRRLGLWEWKDADDVDSLQTDMTRPQEAQIHVQPLSAEQELLQAVAAQEPVGEKRPRSVSNPNLISRLSEQHLLETSEPEVVSRKISEPNQTAEPDDLILESMNNDDAPSEPAYRRLYNNATTSFKGYLEGRDSIGDDFYLGMFTWDLIVFLLTIIFWTSFSGDNSGEVNMEFLYTVFSQNTVPPLFVAILVINFCLIVIDRAVYTAKSMVGKLIVQYTTVLAFTTWIFFFLPSSNNTPFSYLPSLQMWFFAKCVYWYYSGLQLKSGYPRLRMNNFLMRSYSALNAFGFMMFRAVPFVWEFRAFIDWTISDTSLGLYNWLKFEDIFANLYTVKCGRVAEQRDSRRFGEPQNRTAKTWFGLLIIVGMIVLLWFPLLLLSIPGTTKSNPVDSAQVQLEIHGFEPFYVQSTPKELIQNFTTADFADFKSNLEFKNLFLSYYSAANLQRASFQPTSMATWSIAPPIKQVLASVLLNNATEMYITFSWALSKTEPSLPPIVRGSQMNRLPMPVRAQLAAAMTALAPNTTVIPLAAMLPRYIHAFPNGPAVNLAPPDNPMLADCVLVYHSTAATNSTASVEWWELQRATAASVTADANVTAASITNAPPGTSPEFVVLSDNVPAISSLSSYGIIGLYVAVVFAVGRFIRILITDLTLRIMYEDLPDPDRILRICFDTILAREFGDFETEETLYWQLITIFRSPQLLLDKTKVKEE